MHWQTIETATRIDGAEIVRTKHQSPVLIVPSYAVFVDGELKHGPSFSTLATKFDYEASPYRATAEEIESC